MPKVIFIGCGAGGVPTGFNSSFFYLQLTMTRAAKINESSLTDQVCRKFDELVTIRYR